MVPQISYCLTEPIRAITPPNYRVITEQQKKWSGQRTAPRVPSPVDQ
jgi:hypothetical protein